MDNSSTFLNEESIDERDKQVFEILHESRRRYVDNVDDSLAIVVDKHLDLEEDVHSMNVDRDFHDVNERWEVNSGLCMYRLLRESKLVRRFGQREDRRWFHSTI